MPARRDPRQSEQTRATIRTTMLIKRLQAFVLAELDPQTGRPVVMTQHQVTTARTLLAKTLPDLCAVDLRGDAEAPVQLNVTVSARGSFVADMIARYGASTT